MFIIRLTIFDFHSSTSTTLTRTSPSTTSSRSSPLSAAFSSSSTWDPVNTASTRRRRCTRRRSRDSLSCRSTNCDPLHILYGINDCNALKQQQRPPIRGRRDWRRRTRRDLPKKLASSQRSTLLFLFVIWAGDRRIQDVEADRPFPFLEKKKGRVLFFLFCFLGRFLKPTELDWIDGEDRLGPSVGRVSRAL